MSTEENIKAYVMKKRHMLFSEVTSLSLHRLLYLVELSDMNKYNEFKTELRTNGYII